jgi:hypothetical protein
LEGNLGRRTWEGVKKGCKGVYLRTSEGTLQGDLEEGLRRGTREVGRGGEFEWVTLEGDLGGGPGRRI